MPTKLSVIICLLSISISFGVSGPSTLIQFPTPSPSESIAGKQVCALNPEELVDFGKTIGAPVELIRSIKENGKLPVPNFAAGGVATPADAALMMQLGAETVFVGSGIYKSDNPPERARAIVHATTHYLDPYEVAKASEGIGEAMKGIEINDIPETERMQERGW